MRDPSWRHRPARVEDRDFLYALNEATIRAHVEKVWGWDDAKQIAFFENRFQPDVWQIIEADGRDIGLLIVKHDFDQVYLAEIQIDPDWQSRGIGSSVVRSLMRDATAGSSLERHERWLGDWLANRSLAAWSIGEARSTYVRR